MIGKFNPHARRLRRDSTDAEQRLWAQLRNRQLGGLKFRRQVTIGPFVADFACVECRLIVEADGGQHDGESDRRRSEALTALGWRIIRFWNHDILLNLDGVIETILEACGAIEEKPLPCPLPRAGEGL